MPQTYITRDGDVLDMIVYQQYGTTENGIVETVLAANVGLASNGPVLPAGISITLPDAATLQPTTTTGVSLWD
jgi:phage tail protein X